MITPKEEIIKSTAIKLVDLILASKNPGIWFDFSAIVLEMGVKKYVKEKEELCEECKK